MIEIVPGSSEGRCDRDNADFTLGMCFAGVLTRGLAVVAGRLEDDPFNA